MQILDWHHAVEHAVDCGKALLSEDSPLLPRWQRRAGDLLAAGDPEALISELMVCIAVIEPKRRDTRERLQAVEDLVRYYRANAHRMKYRPYRDDGLPIGSGCQAPLEQRSAWKSHESHALRAEDREGPSGRDLLRAARAGARDGGGGHGAVAPEA